ncbi:hypothetical protein FHX74_002935 [Friedmanniella endophytica]|uniref:Uncharacterized protein n=1 Tax=Microlunatus kandeliicorticis TaxID=1759536 RepID=A0A7W3IU52_9ACTN|nr:hypothetical protein [Microlunatus kandeliicorticis]MBA8795307.1 hypothetical protein [Microlunatus kandeliicorticis]
MAVDDAPAARGLGSVAAADFCEVGWRVVAVLVPALGAGVPMAFPVVSTVFPAIRPTVSETSCVGAFAAVAATEDVGLAVVSVAVPLVVPALLVGAESARGTTFDVSSTPAAFVAVRTVRVTVRVTVRATGVVTVATGSAVVFLTDA